MAYRTQDIQNQVAGKVSIIPGAVSEWLLSLIRLLVQGYMRNNSCDETRYLSIYLQRRASSKLHFDPPKLGDGPPTTDLI